MCLRFAFLLITRVTTWLRLSRREEEWQTAEILILRHQLAVLQRRQPRRPDLNWADRALLAALLSVIPKSRHQGLRLLVTPDTILRWHRDIVRRRWAARSKRGRTGRPAWESTSRRRPYGRSSRPAAPAPRHDGPGQPGHSSCAPRPRQSWPATSSQPACPAAPTPTFSPRSGTRPGGSASSASRCTPPGNGPPSRPAT